MRICWISAALAFWIYWDEGTPTLPQGGVEAHYQNSIRQKQWGWLHAAGFDDAVVIASCLDSYTDHLRLVRSSLWQIVSPLYYVAEAPYSISSDLKQTFISRQELLAQLERQRVELLALSHTAQRYQSLKADNDRMRKLLESKAKLPGSVLIAEIVSVRATPSAHYVVIDKGAVDGLQVGQAVLDAQGLFVSWLKWAALPVGCC